MESSSIVPDLLDFIGASPTPYHAVESATRRLREAGFKPLREDAKWTPLQAGRYYVEQGGSAIAAFVVADTARARAFHMVGAHTDSPNLRLKPATPARKEGYLQPGVEVYGGALLNSWLDRDLGIAGRVVVSDDERRIATRLVRFDRPLARVAQLAIHLDRDVNDKGLVLNRQNHLAPLLGLDAGTAGGAATRSSETEAASSAAANAGGSSATKSAENPLLTLCAEQLGVPAESIAGLDLMLYDLTRPCTGGLGDEFIFSARLDNLAMCHAATTALIATSEADGDAIRMAVLFDHEEVGSQSATGAGSGFLPRLLERITAALGRDREQHHQMLAASLCISADMAHAIHPNYADRHEPTFKPQLNKGPVIKINTQQRYATCARTAALFRRLCEEASVPVQSYVHRTDLQCGSTIGPITSTLLGIPTVDVGNPMLSMHSAREMGGSRDPQMMGAAMERFFALSAGALA